MCFGGRHKENDALPTRKDRMNDDGADEMVERNTAGLLLYIGGRGRR